MGFTYLAYLMGLLIQNAWGDSVNAPQILTLNAQQLWEEARNAFVKREDSEAILLLNRCVTAYSYSPFYSQARLYLAKALVRTGAWLEAIPVLESTKLEFGRGLFDLEAKLLLGELYLKQKKFQLSYWASVEINQRLLSKQDEVKPPSAKEALYQGAQRLKARALIGLGQIAEASRIVAELKTRLVGSQANQNWLVLKVQAQLAKCRKLLEEAEQTQPEFLKIRSQHADCFQKALVDYQKLRVGKAADPIEEAEKDLKEAWDEKVSFCRRSGAGSGEGFGVSQKLKQECESEWKEHIQLLKLKNKEQAWLIPP